MPESAAEIMARPEPELIEILRDPNATVFAKAKACQRLAVSGSAACVPALAALLTDPKLSHYARFGLEPIPDPAAGKALRSALDATKGPLRTGVINSIGVRKDSLSSPALIKLLRDRDADTAKAAAFALGKIGGTDAASALQRAWRRSPPEVRTALAHAGLACAEGLAAEGKHKEAARLYEFLERNDAPEPVRAAAGRASA